MQLSPTDRPRWPWLLVVVLAAVLAATWWEPSPDEAVVLAPAPAPAIANRVPAPEVRSPAAAPARAPAPAFKFVGAVMAGAGSLAMVRHTTDSQLLELRVGDRVEGLVVTAIGPDRVTLAGATGSVVIETETQAAVPAPLAPALAAVPVPHAIPIEQPPAAYGGPAPEDEVGH